MRYFYDQATVGRSIPASGDFLDAVFFIFPEELYDHIVFANIRTNVNLDSVKKEQMKIVDRRDGIIIVQPLFFGRDTIEYPILVAQYTDGIKVGLTFDSRLEEYDDSQFKLGILFQQLEDKNIKFQLSTGRYDMHVRTYGKDNRIIFISGLCYIEKISALDGEYSQDYIIVDPYVNHVDRYAIPYYSENKMKEECIEFDNYIPINITNSLINKHPINRHGYFNPLIKKAI